MNTQGMLSRPIRLTMAVRIAATESNATVATRRVFIGWLLNQGSPSPAPTAHRQCHARSRCWPVHLPLPAFTAQLAHGPGQKEHAIETRKTIRQAATVGVRRQIALRAEV